VNGDGVTTSFDKAVELYQRAADLGDTSAMVQSGRVLRRSGSGVAASMRIGVEFILRASALGQANAKQLIDSGCINGSSDETFYVVVTGLMSGP
jgi:TPR repeat protein